MTRTVDIGGYKVGAVWLAPMAGYTDIAFRELCKSYGAGLTVSEMVSVRGLMYGSANTAPLMRLADSEKPSCIQLFGSEPDDFARVADKLDCDMIDINMGCPMPKIVKNGDGSALLDAPDKAAAIVRALIRATGKPVTVKTRLGRRNGENTAARLLERVVEAGAAAVTVHGRYAEQRYSGVCDTDAVKALDSLPVPVVLSGDVDRGNIAERLGRFSAVAVGRAALGDPAIFGGVTVPPETVAREHMRLLVKYFDDRYAVNQARKFFVHYFKGADGGKALRAAVNVATTADDVFSALDKFTARS